MEDQAQATRPLVVAIIHRDGNDLDCLDSVVGVDAVEVSRAIVEMLVNEVAQWNADCAEYGTDEPITTVPTWDGTDEDWARLCKDHDMVVFFHNHQLPA